MLDAVGNKVDALGGQSMSLGEAQKKVGAAGLAMGVALGAGLGLATKSAMGFDAQMSSVDAALGGVAGGTMRDLEDQALDLGASSRYSAGEIGRVQEQLAKSGIGAEQLLGGATQAVTDLAAATGEDLVGSGESAAAMMNMFGLEGKQVGGVADTITAGLNNSSASLSDFQRGINNLGPVMANLGRYADDPVKAFEDTAAAVAYFNSKGLKAADAGISLARGMTNLADPTSDASEQMAALGINAFDAEGNFLPLPDLFDQLQTSMSGMSDQAREQALATIFGAEAADVMNQAIKSGGDPLREYEKRMVSSGQASTQAGIRMDNLAGSVEELSGAMETALVVVGKAISPVVRPFVDAAAAIISGFTKLPAPIIAAIAGLASVAAAALTAGGAFLLLAPKVLEGARAFQTMRAALQAAGGLGNLMGQLSGGTGTLGTVMGKLPPVIGRVTAPTTLLGRAMGGLSRLFGGLGGIVARFIPALGAMNPVVLGIGAALAVAGAAVLAYKTNFLGFGTAVRAVGNEIAASFNHMLEVFAPVGSAIKNEVVASFQHMVDVLRPVGAAIKNEIVASFENLKSQTFDPVVAAVRGFADEFSTAFDEKKMFAAAGGFEGLALNVVAFGRTIEEVTGLPVSGFFDALGKGIQTVQVAAAMVVPAIQNFGREFVDTFNQEQLWAAAGGFDGLAGNLVAFGRTVEDVTGLPVAGFFEGLGRGVQGVQDAFTLVVPAVQGFVREFGAAFEQQQMWAGAGGFEGIAQDVVAFGRAMEDVTGLPVSGFFDGLGRGIQNVQTVIGGVTRSVADFGTAMSDAFRQETIFAGAGGFDGLAQDVVAFGRALEEVTGLPVSGVFESLGRGLQTIQDAFSGDLVSSMVDFGLSVANFARDIATLDFGTVGEKISAFGASIKEAFSSDIVGTIKEFGTGIADFAQSLSTFDLGVVGEQFREIGTAVKDAFSGDIVGTIEDFGNGIRNFFDNLGKFDLSSIGQQFKDIGTSIKEAFTNIEWGGITEGITTAVGEIGTSIGNALREMDVGDLSSALTSAGSSLVDGLRTGWDTAIETFKAVMTALGPDLANLVTGAGDALKTAGTALVAGLQAGWSAAIEGFKAIIGRFPESLASLVSGAGSALQAAGTALVTGLQAGWSSAIEGFKAVIGRFPESLASLVSGAGSALQAAGTALVTGLQQGWTSAIEAFKAVIARFPESLASLVSGAGDALRAVGTQMVEGLRAGWDSAIEGFKAIVARLPSSLGSLAIGAVDALRSVGSGLVEGLTAGWTEAIEGFKTIISSLGSDIAGLATGAVTALEGVGTALANGLKTGFETVIGAGKSIFDFLFGGDGGGGGDVSGDAEAITTDLTTYIQNIADTLEGADWQPVSMAMANGINDAFVESFKVEQGENVAGAEQLTGAIAENLAANITTGGADAFLPVGQALQTQIAAGLQQALAGGVEGEAPSGAADAGSLVTGLAAGITDSITSAGPESFVAAGQALAGQLTAGLQQALVASDGAEGPGAFGTAMATNLATGLTSALGAVSPEVFAPAGQVLAGQVTAGLSQALQQGADGGGQDGGANAFGAAMVTTLAAGITAAIGAAGAEAFASAGTAISQQLTTAIGTALSGGDAGGAKAAAPELGVQMVTDIAAGLAQTVVSAGAAPFEPAAQAVMTNLTEAIQQAFAGGVSGGVGGGGTGPSGIGQQIATSIAEAIGSADFAAAAEALQTQMTTVVETAFTEVQTAITTAMTEIQTAVTTGFTEVQTAVTTAMTEIQTTVTTGFAEIQTAVTTAMTEMTTAMTTGFTDAQTAATTAMGEITTAITTGFTEAASAATTGIGEIVAAVSDGIAEIAGMAGEAEAAGAAIGEGLARGLESQVGAVRSAASALADAAADAIAAAAQIASPSKVTTRLGGEMGQGLADGIGQSAPIVGESAAYLADSASAALASSLEAASAADRVAVENYWASFWTTSAANAAAGAGPDMDYMNDYLTHISDPALRDQVMAEGQRVAEGYAQGIGSVTPDVMQASADLAGMSVDALATELDTARMAGQSQGAAMAQGVQEAKPLIDAAWSDVLGGIEERAAGMADAAKPYVDSIIEGMREAHGAGAIGGAADGATGGGGRDRAADGIERMRADLSSRLDQMREELRAIGDRPVQVDSYLDGDKVSKSVTRRQSGWLDRGRQTAGSRREAL